MKKGIGILGIILSAALWYLASAGGSTHVAAGTRKPASVPESSVHAFAPNPFYLANATGSTVRPLSHSPAPAPQPFHLHGLLPAAAERFLLSRYAHYLTRSGAFLIQFRKADLIFPFHYFW